MPRCGAPQPGMPVRPWLHNVLVGLMHGVPTCNCLTIVESRHPITEVNRCTDFQAESLL